MRGEFGGADGDDEDDMTSQSKEVEDVVNEEEFNSYFKSKDMRKTNMNNGLRAVRSTTALSIAQSAQL